MGHVERTQDGDFWSALLVSLLIEVGRALLHPLHITDRRSNSVNYIKQSNYIVLFFPGKFKSTLKQSFPFGPAQQFS